MALTKIEEIKNNLNKINVFLNYTDAKKMQPLINLLANPDAIIPQTFNDSAFNQTKEILNIIVPQSMIFEGETPAQQERLAKKLIKDCMMHLLSMPDPAHRTRFDILDFKGIPPLIAEFTDISHLLKASKSTHGFFKPTIERRKLQNLLHAVVWSDAEGIVQNKVVDILENEPELLFQKGQITKKGIESSKMYCVISEPTPDRLDEYRIYLKKVDNKVSYSLITPAGKTIKNIKTNIDAPTEAPPTGGRKLSYSRIVSNNDRMTITDKLKKAVLNHATKAGHTPILYEQTYYDVSPFQLILFLGDLYLLDKIKPFITEENRNKAQQQCDELNVGGSDLVKIGVIQDGDRIKDIRKLSYLELTRCVEEHRGNSMRSSAYCLQENKDAVVLYNNLFFHVSLNHDTKTVTNIEAITVQSIELLSLFNRMSMNTSRRSTDQEHRLIAASTGIQLERKGIRYKREKDDYQDCKAESLIIQAAINYSRLWTIADEQTPRGGAWQLGPDHIQAEIDDSWNNAETAWFDLGKAQAMDTANKLVSYNNSSLQKRDFKYKTNELHSERGCRILTEGEIYSDASMAIYSDVEADNAFTMKSMGLLGVTFSLLRKPTAHSWAGIQMLSPDRGKFSYLAAISDSQILCKHEAKSRAEIDEFTTSLNLPDHDSSNTRENHGTHDPRL